MIFVFNCILSGCTVAVFIPKYKIMVRGEADWKRGTWNDCFYPDKSSTDSLQPVWRTKMNMHISFFLSFLWSMLFSALCPACRHCETFLSVRPRK